MNRVPKSQLALSSNKKMQMGNLILKLITA